MGRGLLVLVVAAIAGVAPATAEGANTYATVPPEAGPVLAGSRALWALPRSDGGFNVRQAEPGGALSTIARFSPPPRTISLIPTVAASPRRIGVSAEAGDSSTYSLRR